MLVKVGKLTKFSINSRNVIRSMHHLSVLTHHISSPFTHMALYLFCRLFAITLIFMQTLADTSCTDCFIHSRAAYYPNSEEHGTDGKKLN